MATLRYTAHVTSNELEDLFGPPGGEDEKSYFSRVIEGLHPDFSRAGIQLDFVDADSNGVEWAIALPETISPEALAIFKTTFGIE